MCPHLFFNCAFVRRVWENQQITGLDVSSAQILEFLWEIQRLGHIVLGKGLGSALGAMATPH